MLTKKTINQLIDYTENRNTIKSKMISIDDRIVEDLMEVKNAYNNSSIYLTKIKNMHFLKPNNIDLLCNMIINSYVFDNDNPDEDDKWGKSLTCPFCGHENIHFKKPVFLEGQDDYKAERPYRGDVIKISMECEAGHQWVLVLGFHKGESFIKIQIDKDRE